MKVVLCGLLAFVTTSCMGARQPAPVSDERLAEVVDAAVDARAKELRSDFEQLLRERAYPRAAGEALHGRVAKLRREADYLETERRRISGDLLNFRKEFKAHENAYAFYKNLVKDNFAKSDRRISELDASFKAQEQRLTTLADDLDSAFLEIQTVHEEMLGVLGVLDGHRELYLRSLQLQREHIEKELGLFEPAAEGDDATQVEGAGDGDAPDDSESIKGGEPDD